MKIYNIKRMSDPAVHNDGIIPRDEICIRIGGLQSVVKPGCWAFEL